MGNSLLYSLALKYTHKFTERLLLSNNKPPQWYFMCAFCLNLASTRVKPSTVVFLNQWALVLTEQGFIQQDIRTLHQDQGNKSIKQYNSYLRVWK